MRDDPLLSLILVFAPLSLLSVGGGASILATLQHESVDVWGWITRPEFFELYGIAQAAPGPGAMIVTLMGWKLAGWAGALVATLSMFVPSSVLYLCMTRVWERYRGTSIHAALEKGLAPVGVGLIMSGGISLIRGSTAGPVGWAVTAAALAVALRTNVHPLAILFGGGALFALSTLT